MPFIENILRYGSVSIVGLEKNTGKTETLNYILQKLQNSAKIIAVTSVGIDGEGIDQVTHTSKPEITFYEKMLFVTSEQHYLTKQLTSEVLDVSHIRTALGRLITARALSKGKVLLSGPSDTSSLQQIIHNNSKLGADLTLVDGALSRLSLASPTVTDAMILATGAAYAPHLPELLTKTKFVCQLIDLPAIDEVLKQKLMLLGKGIYAISNTKEIHSLNISSVLLFESYKERLLQYGTTLYVSGVVNDKLLNFLRMQKTKEPVCVIVKDFTKLFISSEAFAAFTRRGGQIAVLHNTRLIAITLNPTSPQGYRLDSQKACQVLSEQLQLPVYDVRQIG